MSFESGVNRDDSGRLEDPTKTFLSVNGRDVVERHFEAAMDLKELALPFQAVGRQLKTFLGQSR